MPRSLRIGSREVCARRASFNRFQLVEQRRSFRFRGREAHARRGACDAEQRSQECTSVHFCHPSVVPHEPVT